MHIFTRCGLWAWWRRLQDWMWMLPMLLHRPIISYYIKNIHINHINVQLFIQILNRYILWSYSYIIIICVSVVIMLVYMECCGILNTVYSSTFPIYPMQTCLQVALPFYRSWANDMPQTSPEPPQNYLLGLSIALWVDKKKSSNVASTVKMVIANGRSSCTMHRCFFQIFSDARRI